MSKQPSSSPHSKAAQPTLDTSGLHVHYVNYHRASGSADELILDFGLNAHQQMPGGPEPIALTIRLAMSWAHARLLFQTLRQLLQHHDAHHAPPSGHNPPLAPGTEER